MWTFRGNFGIGNKFSQHLFAFRNYQFKLEKVEAFRYRAQDAWRVITKIAIRDARVKEIKQELFNCEKLKVRNK